eukprot:CAMPEP_0168343176 /NCGR_PEP_ID=MMETSP0213-20121227/15895_1 /TAXON_ID=151035 /ORGANISM="Euplotes harpa, Strain FSP1.4" /LENGTH=118 /DNA_ID=CAMNT_0008350337 /DNA_START=20 /DNA_END=376 /DNA_ORIENTATION=+
MSKKLFSLQSISFSSEENIGTEAYEFEDEVEVFLLPNTVKSTPQFFNILRSDKGQVRKEDREKFGLKKLETDDQEDDFRSPIIKHDGHYNRFTFMHNEDPNEPLLTIVEESCESDLKY